MQSKTLAIGLFSFLFTARAIAGESGDVIQAYVRNDVRLLVMFPVEEWTFSVSPDQPGRPVTIRPDKRRIKEVSEALKKANWQAIDKPPFFQPACTWVIRGGGMFVEECRWRLGNKTSCNLSLKRTSHIQDLAVLAERGPETLLKHLQEIGLQRCENRDGIAVPR